MIESKGFSSYAPHTPNSQNLLIESRYGDKDTKYNNGNNNNNSFGTRASFSSPN